MAYIDLDEINRLHPNLTAKYPLSFANGISAAISEINKLPNADVVPKSEVEKLEAEIERLKKYNTDVAFKHYNDGKADAVSEIFAEIERTFNAVLVGDISDILKVLAELKKKYTEETK